MRAPLVSEREELRAMALAQRQPESGEQLRELLDKLEGRLVQAALANRKVARRLEVVRHRAIGADLHEEKPRSRRGRLVEVGFYDYESDVLVVAILAARTGSLVRIEERRVQPALALEEIEESRELVLADDRFSGLRRRRLEPVALLAQRQEGESHRLVELYLWSRGRAQERIASALVDLSAREVKPYVPPWEEPVEEEA